MPERVQLRRTSGYRKPEGAIVVARPGKWGNPFPVKGDWIMWTAIALGFRGDESGRRRAAVAIHRSWLTNVSLPGAPTSNQGGSIEFANGVNVTMDEHCRGIAAVAATLVGTTPSVPERPSLDEIRQALAGRDLACWCPLDQPCHADTLLELANDALVQRGAEG